MSFFSDHDGPAEEQAAIAEVSPGPAPLSRIRSGQVVRVDSLPECPRAASQLLALGLTPGAEVRVVQNLFGPIILDVRGSRLSLGHNLASRLLVKPGTNGHGRERWRGRHG